MRADVGIIGGGNIDAKAQGSNYGSSGQGGGFPGGWH